MTPELINACGYTVKEGTTYRYSIADASVAKVNVTEGDEAIITSLKPGATYLIVYATIVNGEQEREIEVILPIYVMNRSVTTISPSSDVEVYVGSTVTLTVSTSNSAVTRWEWKVIAGSNNLERDLVISGTQVTVTGKNAGTAVVAAIGYNSNGDVVDVATKTLTVKRNS